LAAAPVLVGLAGFAKAVPQVGLVMLVSVMLKVSMMVR
jgi:hypothetical protein